MFVNRSCQVLNKMFWDRMLKLFCFNYWVLKRYCCWWVWRNLLSANYLFYRLNVPVFSLSWLLLGFTTSSSQGPMTSWVSCTTVVACFALVACDWSWSRASYWAILISARMPLLIVRWLWVQPFSILVGWLLTRNSTSTFLWPRSSRSRSRLPELLLRFEFPPLLQNRFQQHILLSITVSQYLFPRNLLPNIGFNLISFLCNEIWLCVLWNSVFTL